MREIKVLSIFGCGISSSMMDKVYTYNVVTQWLLSTIYINQYRPISETEDNPFPIPQTF